MHDQLLCVLFSAVKVYLAEILSIQQSDGANKAPTSPKHVSEPH